MDSFGGGGTHVDNITRPPGPRLTTVVGVSPKSHRHTESGLPFEPVYGPDALDGFEPQTALGEPGAFPYTRGVYPSMYTGRP